MMKSEYKRDVMGVLMWKNVRCDMTVYLQKWEEGTHDKTF